MGSDATLAIQDMIARYAYAYDGGDADAFAEVFAANGMFEIFVPGKTEPVVRLPSRDEIREWAAQRLAQRRGQFTGRHFQAGVLFDELTGEEARVRVMFLVTRQDAAGTPPDVTLTGVYRDRWGRTNDGWRLTHRAAYADRDPGF